MAQCQSRLHRSFRNDCDDGRQTGFGEDAPADAHICLYLYFHARTHLVEIFYSHRRVDTISAIRVIAALFWVTTNCQETRNFATGNKQYHNMTKIALGTWAIAKGMLPIIRATRVRHVVEGQGAKELYVNLGASHVDLYGDVAGIIPLRQDGTVLP